MKELQVINWNISYMGNIDTKLAFLESVVGLEDCVIILQEVTSKMNNSIRNRFGDNWDIEYSIDYRPAGKFDTKARKLGVVICITANIKIVSADVLNRSPFPDRTLAATVKYNGHELKVINLHSTTGCSYKKAKSVNHWGRFF